MKTDLHNSTIRTKTHQSSELLNLKYTCTKEKNNNHHHCNNLHQDCRSGDIFIPALKEASILGTFPRWKQTKGFGPQTQQKAPFAPLLLPQYLLLASTPYLPSPPFACNWVLNSLLCVRQWSTFVLEAKGYSSVVDIYFWPLLFTEQAVNATCLRLTNLICFCEVPHLCNLDIARYRPSLSSNQWITTTN